MILDRFFLIHPLNHYQLAGSYNFSLVALSYIIAVLASYVALDMASQLVRDKIAKNIRFWHISAAVVLGAGIWSMHFTGMLAYRMEMEHTYNLGLTLLSLILPIISSYFVFLIVKKPELKTKTILLAAPFLGLGIASMHYTGMWAMNMQADLRYQPGWFIGSLLIAVLASAGALLLTFQATNTRLGLRTSFKVLAALVMGAAICGMHYAAMEAAVFRPYPDCVFKSPQLGWNVMLALAIGGVMLLILSIAAVALTINHKLTERLKEEVIRRTQELEATNQLLLEAKERSRLMMESIKDYAIISMNTSGIITAWNQGAETIFGFQSEEAVGQTASFIFTPEDREAGADIEELEVAKRLGRAVDERWHLRSDGKRFYANGVLSAVTNEQGELLGFTKVARDVTVQKQTEELMIEAKNAAEAANMAKSEFLANMSHEIRTPMNAVIGLSNILAMTAPLTVKQQDCIRTLQLSADSLLNLINDLLDISKIESRTVELEAIPFNLEQMIRDVLSVMSIRAHEKKLALTMEVECVKDSIFIGDPTRLRQIIMNLCSNAIKFTHQGRIHITTTCHADASSYIKHVYIAVQDSGIGIDPNKLSAIFEKFMQADTSINRKYGGSGLGLAITKTLTEIMGGSITVESTVGKGSIFTVSLPLTMAAPNTPLAYLDGTHITLPDESLTAANEKVLLVEDYAPNILVAQTYLEEFGYKVELAANGLEAVEKFKRGNIKVVLMDIQMPGTNGLEATRLIREYEKQEGLMPTRIIGMTAHALAGDREQCLRFGMDDYISKPFDPIDLQTKLLKR